MPCARSGACGASPSAAFSDARPYLLLSPEAAEEFASVPTSRPYDAVVVGLHPPSFAYGPLNTAFRVLAREPLRGAPAPDTRPVLIAPHTAAYLQAPADGEFPAGLSLGIGAYVAALEAAAGTKAEVVGKPTRAFFELALDRLRQQRAVDAREVAIVGDDVRNDLGAGASELGLQRVLGTWACRRARADASENGQVPRRRRGGGPARRRARDVCRLRRRPARRASLSLGLQQGCCRDACDHGLALAREPRPAHRDARCVVTSHVADGADAPGPAPNHGSTKMPRPGWRGNAAASKSLKMLRPSRFVYGPVSACLLIFGGADEALQCGICQDACRWYTVILLCGNIGGYCRGDGIHWEAAGSGDGFFVNLSSRRSCSPLSAMSL